MMELVETIEVGAGGAASIEFTSIPQDGVDLLLVVSARATNAATANTLAIQLNNDTGSNYTTRRLYGDGSTVYSSTTSSSYPFYASNVLPAASATSNTFSSVNFYLSNYTSSSSKSASTEGVGENNATTAYQLIDAGLWNNSATVNEIDLLIYGSTFAQYSTASLYIIS